MFSQGIPVFALFSLLFYPSHFICSPLGHIQNKFFCFYLFLSHSSQLEVYQPQANDADSVRKAFIVPLKVTAIQSFYLWNNCKQLLKFTLTWYLEEALEH